MAKVLFGFHAVGVRLKTAPESVLEVHVDVARRDGRMRQFAARARAVGVRLVDSDDAQLARLAGSARHQGVVARVEPLPLARTIPELLDAIETGPPLLLVLDGVTDPHNLGACLRVADGHGVRVVGAADDAERSLHDADLRGALAFVLGAEGTGMRQLTRKTCDELVRVPMRGAVESLNVSVAAGVCLYEVIRQRGQQRT
jgi:23S rRNA (guanosine2251-2'-O)-methyltransferase